jgi:exodeoxyribonuclease VII large subunit
VLARGFALVQDADGGATLTAAADVPAGGRLVLTFADGQVGTTADGAKPGLGRRRDGRDPADQGALL